MTAFIRQTIRIMLVAGEAGPTALTHREKLADQQATDLVVIVGAQNMLDLAVSFCVVRAILHDVEIGDTDVKRFQNLVIFGTGNEAFGLITQTSDARLGPDRT